MTITESRPETSTDEVAAHASSRPAPSGLAALIGTGDSNAVGRLFIATSLLFAAFAAVMGAIVGVDRVDTSSTWVGADGFRQMYTLHSVSAVFLFLLPFVLGIAMIVVPRQVGSSTVAFPRAAAGAFWFWVISSGVLLGAYAINGGPFGGDGEGVDLFLVAFGGVIVALLLASICVVTTVVGLRTAGMTLDRVPLFSWSMLVAGSMWLLSLPVLLGTTVLLYVDHRNGRVLLGGTDGIYLRLLWVFGQPQLYAFAVPALGFVGDVIPVFAGARARLRQVQPALIAAVGVLGFGAWTQAVAVTSSRETAWLNQDLTNQALYGLMAVAVLLPLLGMLGTVADTLRGGRPRLASPLLFAVTALLLLLAGAAAGAVGAIRDLDLINPDTTWTSGQAHLVLLAVAAAAIGAAHYWGPQLFGRMLHGGAGLATGALVLVGSALLAGADLVSGAYDQPAFLQEGPVRDGVELLNGVSLAGGALVTIGVLVFIGNILASLRGPAGSDLPVDPWGGHTLEWTDVRPLPVVTSPEPLLDQEASA